MIELISRQSLLNKYDAEHKGAPGRARRLIEEEPTIEERKTGRWSKAYDGYDGHVMCRNCYKIYDWTSEAQYFNFCPKCGADMRGKENGKNGI